MLNEQAKHIAYIIETAKAKGYSRVEATEQGEAGWVQRCIDRAREPVTFSKMHAGLLQQ